MSNSGKYLEDMVQKYFDKNNPDLWCHRFMDSHAARNLGARQPADFLISIKGVIGADVALLECKSVKHKFRLPKFAQHSRMVRAAMTGIRGIVLIHHWQIDRYRVVNVNELTLGAASHDLRDRCEEMNWDEAMEELV